ncbi:conjugal transfer protein TraG N-terminal domain-containing protein [Burkholderia anthina]|uniref:conjugal transfer protein TraG N-terminal domain-containing protein n=1 Tax=Burkholderia anthina TaxID=179879 RepID=UPI00158EA5E3|nr:conjugal transfer protein TraG N-terminal domain-containing protein [Burkholderia anthina]
MNRRRFRLASRLGITFAALVADVAPSMSYAGLTNMQAPSVGSFPTLYVAGDPVPIVAGLNAVAMLFGHGNTMDSVVVGGMSCMALVGLISILGQSIFQQRFLIGQYFVMLLAAVMLFIPTTSLQVVSYFGDSGGAINGSPPRYVDNVPIGMAYAAGIAGLVDYTITTKLETAFSMADSDNNYMSLGTDGFAKPLKILLSMRTLYDPNVHQTTTENIQKFIHYCQRGGVDGSKSLDFTQLDNPAAGAGILGLLASQPGGYTEYVDQSVDPLPPPALVPCSVAANGLANVMQAYVQNQAVRERFAAQPVTMGKDLQVVTAATDNTIETPNSTFGSGGSAYDSYSTFIQNMVARIGADSNTFMINHTFSPTVLAAIRADANPDSAAQFAMIMGEGVERAHASMAASGSMFVTFMTSSMNVMTFLFVALTPIIAIIGVAVGLAAFRIYFTYLLFGMWTQSWMPCAAIISYYIQVSWQNMITGSRLQGALFAPSQIDTLYNQTANMLASAGSLMAEAPLIMLIVMTGSMFALTSLANRANGSDTAVDTKQPAPSLDAATNAASISNAYAMNTGKALAGPSYQGMLSSGTALTSADVDSSPTLTTGSGFADGLRTSAAATASAQTSVAAYADAMSSISARYGRSAATALNASITKQAGMSHRITDAAQQAIDHASATSEGTSNSNRNTTRAEVSGSAGFKLLGNGGGISGGISKDVSSSRETSARTGTSITEGSRSGKEDSADHGTSSSVINQGTVATQAGFDRAAQEALRLGTSAQESLQRANSAEHSLQAQAQASAQTSIKMGALTQNAQMAPQAAQQAAVGNALVGARSVAQQAFGSDIEGARAVMSRLTEGMSTDGGYSPMNTARLMRNATRLLRSNDFGDQAVGYRVAAAVSSAVGYGDSEGLSRTASAYADSARTMNQVRSALTPGMSDSELAKAGALQGDVHTRIHGSAGKLGVPNPESPDSVAGRVGSGGLPAMIEQFGHVERGAAGVKGAAESVQDAAAVEESRLERQGGERQVNARVIQSDDTGGNPANSYRLRSHYNDQEQTGRIRKDGEEGR